MNYSLSLTWIGCIHHLPVSPAKRDDISDNVELCDVGYSQGDIALLIFQICCIGHYQSKPFAGLSSFNDERCVIKFSILVLKRSLLKIF